MATIPPLLHELYRKAYAVRHLREGTATKLAWQCAKRPILQKMPYLQRSELEFDAYLKSIEPMMKEATRTVADIPKGSPKTFEEMTALRPMTAEAFEDWHRLLYAKGKALREVQRIVFVERGTVAQSDLWEREIEFDAVLREIGYYEANMDAVELQEEFLFLTKSLATAPEGTLHKSRLIGQLERLKRRIAQYNEAKKMPPPLLA